MKLRNSGIFPFYLSSSFKYEQILIKRNMNINIMKMQMSSKVKKVFLTTTFQNHIFCDRYIFCLTLNLLKPFKNHNFIKTQSFHKRKYDLKGHIRPLLCQNHSSTFVYGLILMKICMNANIMKKFFFH